jgi:hypothetical protein
MMKAGRITPGLHGQQPDFLFDSYPSILQDFYTIAYYPIDRITLHFPPDGKSFSHAHPLQ